MSTRKRANSIIPVELIKDTTDGGIERAALATVFGVKEYTESKIFWSSDSITSVSFKPFESLCSLPTIPKVSEFGDIWIETDKRHSHLQHEQQCHDRGIPPLDLSDYPLTLFDIVKSDNSPCIIWRNTSNQSHQHETVARKKHIWSTELFSRKQEPVVTDVPQQREIEAATIEKLVEKMTVSLDYAFMTDFFLIYRIFMTPIQLAKFLISRFITFVTIRHWLLNYYLHDFVPNKELRIILTKFLNEISLHPVIKQSPRDKRIIKTLRRVVRRLKRLYYTSSTDVQVIEPPPPTFEQARVTEMVKDKLSKNTIRQRIHGIHVDRRHRANTAIRDKQTAPVVVIGSTRYNSTTAPLYQTSTHSRSASSLPIDESNYMSRTGVNRNEHDSDESIGSYLTPGTSGIEDEEEDEDDDEEQEQEEQQEQEMEDAALQTDLSLQEQQKLENARIRRSFYNAQLAIPSITSPSSDNITPIIDGPTRDYFDPELNTSKRQKEKKKDSLYSNRIDKPLPPISTGPSPAASIRSYFSHKVDNQSKEQWKFAIKNKHSDKSLRSRITEMDIPPNNTSSRSNNNYQSILLSYPTSVIAQQFCLIERNILLGISWEELVDVRWTKMPAGLHLPSEFYNDDDSDVSGEQFNQPGIYSRKKRMKQQQEREKDYSERGVEKAIHRFNAVCQWVSSEIVQTGPIEARKCKLYCNFSTLIQILLGLQSSSVSRLEKTWSMVSKREMKVLKELSTFTSPTKNWKNLRDSMTQVAEEYGETPTEIQVENMGKNAITVKLPFGGCIPFLGIYLSDLVFNAELPSYIPSNYNPSAFQSQLEATVLSQPLIHFRKHRITASIIKKVLIFQALAKRYSFVENLNDKLYLTCLQVPCLETDEIQKRSYQIESLLNGQ
ncbi:ras GEF [Rhizopus microsporus var. microsporus]|uniref:Ras GEF n=1 Tax=Rhizopus microsporus var. microsporus TaxID=86635 RepID=A0A1X0QPK1_RHIZD|nr:ras GEF [Rhizopus microsporus var. microsporus]